MMKIMKISKIGLILAFLLLLTLLLTSISLAQGELKGDTKNEKELKVDSVEKDNIYEEEFNKAIEGDIYEDVGEVELKGKAGLTPDSNFYFLESLIETVLVGDDPETALKYKEEKILEVKEMIKSGDKEAAKKALEKAGEYNEIIRREVSPDVELKVRESSKAVKKVLNSFESELEDNQWKDVQKIVAENLKEEDKVALAAKISKQIEQLCKALSGLDPLEYSNVCKTGDNAPKWKKDLDRKLTAEQKKEAQEFFTIMSECFQNPSKCRCEDISVKPFAERCSEFAPLAAKCQAGNEDACEMMEEIEDPIELLPDYLQEVLEDVEDKYGDAKYDLSVPSECVEAGATSREDCMKVMFKVHAPPECQEALASGKIDPKNENEARKACDAIMFDSEAPEECKDAGLKDFRECERYMFKLDAPKECLDAGLTGSGRDDWKKCEAIRFRLDSPKECLDAGITGENKDDWKKCDAVKFKLDAPKECLDAGLTGEGRDDWKKCEVIRFKLDSPKECLDAGLTGEGRDDWKKCEAIRFRLEAHPDCLAAGLTGEGRDDWKKCQEIQFKAEAPQECLDAGLTGKGRRDWDECNKIREKLDDKKEQQGCSSGEQRICDDENSNCRCVRGERQDQRQDNKIEDHKDYNEVKTYKDVDGSGSQNGQGVVISPPDGGTNGGAGAGTGNAVLPPEGSSGSEGSGSIDGGDSGSSGDNSGNSGGSGSSDGGSSGSEGGSSNSGSDSSSGSESSNSGGSSSEGSSSSESSSSSEGGSAITGGAITDWNFLKKLKWWG